MKKSRYSNDQIVRILREAYKDLVAEVAKRHGVSEQSIYGWCKRFTGAAVDEVKELQNLTRENARLKKLLTERNLEIEVMKEITAKNSERTSPSDCSVLRNQARHLATTCLCVDADSPIELDQCTDVAAETGARIVGDAQTLRAVPPLRFTAGSCVSTTRRPEGRQGGLPRSVGRTLAAGTEEATMAGRCRIPSSPTGTGAGKLRVELRLCLRRLCH
jgi:putative transposase